MPAQSATTYMETPSVGGDLAATIKAASAEAAKRLGGEDGLRCVSAHLTNSGVVAMTWCREWVEPDAKG